MRLLWRVTGVLLLTLSIQAAGMENSSPTDPDADVALRLTLQALNETVPAGDPRVAQTRGWLARAMRASGETDDQAVAATCVRLSRYLFDVTKQRVSPLEVLEALARHAPAGKPLQETTQRYFELRAKQKLDHAGALTAMAGK